VCAADQFVPLRLLEGRAVGGGVGCQRPIEPRMASKVDAASILRCPSCAFGHLGIRRRVRSILQSVTYSPRTARDGSRPVSRGRRDIRVGVGCFFLFFWFCVFVLFCCPLTYILRLRSCK